MFFNYRKTYFFFVVSVGIFDIFEVSVDIFEDVSIGAGGATAVESIVIFELSDDVLPLVVALSLQAANAPIDKTNKIFFMFKFLFVNNLYS